MKRTFLIGALICLHSTVAYGQIDFADSGAVVVGGADQANFGSTVPSPVPCGGPATLVCNINPGWDGEAIRVSYDGQGGRNDQGVAFPSTFTGVYSTLSFEFEIRFNNRTEDAGAADGFGFVYVNTDLFGEVDGPDPVPAFVGEREEPNLQGSLGIGFDTWSNGGLDGDNATDSTLPNSISLHYDGVLLKTVDMGEVGLPDDFLENGEQKRVFVDVIRAGSGANVSVTLLDLVADPQVETVVLNNEPVEGFVPYDGRVIFAVRTGGEDADQDVDNISVIHDGTRDVLYGISLGELPGDVNQDKITDEIDYGIAHSNYGKVGLPGPLFAEGDANRNGRVDLFDHRLIKDFQGFCDVDDEIIPCPDGSTAAHAAVPEPTGAALAFAALVGVGFLQFRNRRSIAA